MRPGARVGTSGSERRDVWASHGVETRETVFWRSDPDIGLALHSTPSREALHRHKPEIEDRKIDFAQFGSSELHSRHEGAFSAVGHLPRPEELPTTEFAGPTSPHPITSLLGPSIAHAAYKRQRRNPAVTEIVKIPNRGHSLTIDHGWREVAETALTFVKRLT